MKVGAEEYDMVYVCAIDRDMTIVRASGQTARIRTNSTACD